MSKSVQDQLAELVPHLLINNSYGSSESGTNGLVETGPDGVARMKPNPAVEVLDDQFRPVAAGAEGRLARRGHSPVGYWKDLVKTASTFAAVLDAVVAGVADPRWGERVGAAVALRPDTDAGVDDLRGHCRTLIAGYKVPAHIVFVSEIIRSPSGKPDYRWAKDQLAASTNH